jgi:hypothetical protein
MFTLSPLPQLVRNFSNLSDLAGLSLGTMLLAMLGNAACIPRALFTRDKAWTWGSTWGCVVMGWAQCLSLFLGVNPATGWVRGARVSCCPQRVPAAMSNLAAAATLTPAPPPVSLSHAGRASCRHLRLQRCRRRCWGGCCGW